MRLLNLNLHNFLSYADEEVDFSGVDLAAIVGANGAGKSSLIDALSWGLFGEGRTSQANDYLRQGTDEGRVEVTFSLGDESYRVIRARSSAGRGKTLLELQRKTSGGLLGEDWEALSGQTATETQKKIVDVLHLDYQAFASSALALQGDVDRFTAASPADRKQVLANILDLDVYQALEAVTREQGRTSKARADEIRRRAESLRSTIDAYGDLDADLAKNQASRAAAQSREVEAAEALANARTAITEAEKATAVLAEVQSQVRPLSGAVSGLQEERAQAAGRVTAVFNEVAAALKSTTKAADLTIAERAQFVLDHLATIRQQDVIETDVATARTERQTLEAEVKARQTIVDANTLGQQAYLTAKAAAAEARQKIMNEIAPIKAEKDAAEDMSQSLPPVGCDSPTAGASCVLLSAAYAAKQRVPDLEAQLVPRRVEYEAIKNPAPFVPATVPEAPDLAPVDTRIRGLEAEMSKATRASAQRERLLAAQERVDALDRDIADKHATLSALQERLNGASEHIEALRVARENENKANDDLDAARKAGEDALLAITRLQGQIERRGADQVALREAEAEAEDATTTVADWATLTRAFGKDGIPAMLVESALPHLEAIANEVLGQIATEPLKVRLETQRETKGGDVKETLDVVIETSDGPRPYDLFSGGEHFRIDFALRVGLAKFLANRSGARVETLIIDEGLAPVDADGKAKFLECLHAIRSDFKTILVVTHHADVQDAFPQQLLVVKDENGSHVQVAA